MRMKAGVLILAGILALPALQLRAESAADTSNQKGALMLASAQIDDLGAAEGAAVRLPDSSSVALSKDLEQSDDNVMLADDSTDSGDSTPTNANPNRVRVNQSQSSDDSDATPPASTTTNPNRVRVDQDQDQDNGDVVPKARRHKRKRIAREHHVLVGLLIPSVILLVGGIVLTVDGFRDNPEPNGSTTLSWNQNGSGDIYDTGTFSNTGIGGEYYTVNINELDGFRNYIGSYTVDTGDDVAQGDTEDWSAIEYGAPATTYQSWTTTETADGGYAANNALEGTLGLVCVIVGTAGTIVSLTHTEEVMADNDIKVEMREADAGELMMAASKGF
jgi:hypothetical protein